MNEPLETCPECRLGKLIERENSKNGNLFMGCSRFPVCRYTEAHPDDPCDESDEEWWSDCDLW
jgi:ssDNA-binding Zn-finger/Zn-ribbon topoisomerase 1